MFLVGDVSLGVRDSRVGEREGVFGGVECGAGGGDGSLVAAIAALFGEVFERGEAVGDGVCGISLVVLVAPKVGLCAGKRVVGVVGHGAHDVLEVDQVGGGRVAELFDTEGEWVVGVHGAQGDVGPVMGEGVVDLGDAFDPPVVLLVPRGTLGDGFLACVDAARASSRWCAARARRRCASTMASSARVMSSRPPRRSRVSGPSRSRSCSRRSSASTAAGVRVRRVRAQSVRV